ncbi:mechanosensitive ion channel [Synechococcus sp. RSCCF101]|uniref:mechanosensitive ion channel family protein n=1 Tax=Synechococcus sp. RSCCF101 TaxID=2511069 RepID=UPI001245342B|nr:mechanosensitive ion channel domain-containing protein [Synechococcus sp. RSCCF101]QEY32672.1 mechanosensitive ion channel [Synechococcus sp. RSCCF101]
MVTSHADDVVLDGRRLFQVWGSTPEIAERRAESVRSRLLQAAQAPDQPPISIRTINGLPVLQTNGSTLVTVTERDVPAGLEAMEQAKLWSGTIAQAFARYRLERTRPYILSRLPLAAAALLAALLAQIALGRIYRAVHRSDSTNAASGALRHPLRRLASLVLLRLLQLAAWTVSLAWIADLFPQTRSLKRTFTSEAGGFLADPLLPFGQNSYSLLDVLILAGLFALVVHSANLLQRWIRRNVLGLTGMSVGSQEAVAFLIRYGILTLAAIILLQLWGLDLTSLTLFASVLGVGFGLGLQGISRNFLSGIVIIFERPIQVGDFVEVDDLQGTVRRLRLRSTEIVTLDGISIIVPNSEFLDTRVVNWSHGSPTSRLQIPVGVAYGSDTALVRDTLIRACEQESRVLNQPCPQVFFSRFGDSALEFTLLVWTERPMQQYEIISSLNYNIDRLFRANGITVPFPQRDLHLASSETLLRLAASLEQLPDALRGRGGDA